jgi:glycosyltransferase involved in cell wall biosynthesis
MELKICDIPPTICLNMIVKNESHIIKNTLEKLCNKINFSYWVICDTGSTDNTPEIISEFFINKDIPGELHNHEWKNFAHNRTIALNEAFNKTDLLFIFDADDDIHGNITMPKTVDNDGYLLNFGFSDGISYQRILLVNNKIRWSFKSVIHEYINCLKPDPKITTLQGDYYVVSGRSGSRNSDPEKYLKDAKILEEAYYEAKKDNDDIYMRYVDKDVAPKKQLRILHVATAVMGIMGITFGISMIGVKSLLDVWWKLSGIFAGGMLGIFLISFMKLLPDFFCNNIFNFIPNRFK